MSTVNDSQVCRRVAYGSPEVEIKLYEGVRDELMSYIMKTNHPQGTFTQTEPSAESTRYLLELPKDAL